VVTALAVAAAVVGGYAVAQREGDPEVTVTDDQSSLSVTVPVAWDRAVATDGWRPSGASGEFAAISAGTDATWTDPTSTGQGVFVGLLPGDELPSQLPQHPECAEAGDRVGDTGTFGPSATVFYTGCPDGSVTVERVVQVTEEQLMWVQVRSHDRATANSVLDDVAVHGM
jgi:hypothetical protein